MTGIKEEICDKCGRKISCSEQAYVFEGILVCGECDKKLRNYEIVTSEKKRPKVMIVIGIFLAVFGLGSFIYFRFLRTKIDLIIRETPLGKSPRNIDSIVISENRKRVAFLESERNDKKIMLVIDGVEVEKYEGFRGGTYLFLFSPDSQRYMYKDSRDKKSFVVIDGVKQKEYDSVGELKFSHDSKRTAYTAKIDKLWRVVIDGVEANAFNAYPYISDLVFSPSGQVVYSALSGRKWVMVIGGIETKLYDNIQEGEPVFSPDGRRMAYAAKQGQKWLMVIDGAESDEFEMISEPVFSPDSNRVMFAAMRNNKHYVIIDGRGGTGYDNVNALMFSPDSKRTAFVAKSGAKWMVVLDGAEGQLYDGIMDLAFSPDGNHFAYLALRNEQGFLVIDGDEQDKYDGAHLLTFSPDGKLIAFCANTGRKEVKLEEDDYEMRRMPGRITGKDMFGFPIFEKDREEKFPNAKGFEKMAKAAGKLLVVVNGRKGRRYDTVANLTFSPDSKNYVYWAHDGDGWIIVVNGVEGKKYDSLIRGPIEPDNEFRYWLAGKLISYPISKFVFDSPTTFHTLARRDNNIVRIDVQIKK